jgi:hypothetical protein
VIAAEAESRLRDLLVAAGVTAARDATWERPATPAPGDPAATWAVWREYGGLTIEDAAFAGDTDGIAGEYLTVDWDQGHGEHFEVSLARHFHLPYGSGGHHDLVRIDCSFLYPPTDSTRALGESGLWSTDVGYDAFFAQVVALPAYRLDEPPVGLRIYTARG